MTTGTIIKSGSTAGSPLTFGAITDTSVQPLWLKYYGFAGEQVSQIALNHAMGGSNGALIGTPVVAAGYDTFTTNSNGVNTGILPNNLPSGTYVCVTRCPGYVSGTPATFATLFGNRSVSAGSCLAASLTANGVYFYINNNGAGGGAQGGALAMASPNTWFLLAITWASSGIAGTAGTCTIQNLTAGTTSTFKIGSALTAGAAPLDVGCDPYDLSGGSGNAGSMDKNFEAIFASSLSAADLAGVAADARAWANFNGITV